MAKWLILSPSGRKRWYEDDALIKCQFLDGSTYYYMDNGIGRHRIDGPAVEYPDGYQEWWINNKRISCHSQEEFEKFMKMKAFW